MDRWWARWGVDYQLWAKVATLLWPSGRQARLERLLRPRKSGRPQTKANQSRPANKEYVLPPFLQSCHYTERPERS